MRRTKAKSAANSASPGATFEVMDDPPLRLRRPLCLIGDYAYAATWPYLKITLTETVDDQGKTLKHNPPLVIYEQRRRKDDRRLVAEKPTGQFNALCSSCQRKATGSPELKRPSLELLPRFSPIKIMP
jgi:hypothetical protein